MEKLINLVSEKAGISSSQAETAVNTVVSFLKDKLPPGMAGQVDNYLKDSGDTGKTEGGAEGADGMADKLGGMMGGKK